MGKLRLQIKRVYDPADEGDGLRVLIDRLWPRGLAKGAAGIDRWLKEIAPTAELRQWFGHDPAKWSEFRQRYFAELDARPAIVGELIEMARKQTLTLLYAAKEQGFNHAVALHEYLRSRTK